MTTSQSKSELGRVIGSYPTYEEAQAVVDSLSDRMFPVEHVTIIGRDLHLVERVTGRLTVLRAGLAGAVTGAWIGLFVGLIFSIVSPWVFAPLLWSIVLGIVFGALWGALAHAMTFGRRDFSSLRGMEASRYEIVVDSPYVEDAQRVLTSPQRV
ncbi:MAG: hypothetical protein QOK10_327 [Pseudonocardiales bacterium]|jgi:hypothetical protein|nr:hypothetical protein [Pseudonocardiales bacterium]